MNRRGRPPVIALTTFSLLAVAASVVLAFLAAEVFNIGAPSQVVGPNSTDVLAMDVFLADNPVQDVKIMPGERASALGDNISYFDFTNGFAGYVNQPLAAGDAGTAFPANTIFADRGNPGDHVPTGQDDQNVGDEFWVDANTDGLYNSGETEVWWEVEPVDGTRGYDLVTWATGAYGFNPANDEIYYKGGPGMDANAPMWIDFNEDGDASGPSGTSFEWETMIFPVGGGGSGVDGTPADVTGPTFGDTPQNEVWADMDGDESFSSDGVWNPGEDVIWDDDKANNLYDDEQVINGAPSHGDAGTVFPSGPANTVMFEDEDLDGTWDPAEDLFEDTNGNGQWDVGETNFTGGVILAGAPGVSLASLSPAYLFVDNGAPGFDFPGDDIFIDTNGSGAYEKETMMWGTAPANGTAGTAFQNGWDFSSGYKFVWDDADGNDEYDADLVIFGAPPAVLSDPAPVQPLLYNGGEEIFVDNIPPAVGFTGLLSLDPDEALNQGQDGVNAAHGANLTFFTYDPEADGVERYADATVPLGDYNDGDEIFEDHDNSMTYTAQADGIVGGDDGPDPAASTWNPGDPLPAPTADLAFLDLNFDGVLSDDEPVVTESMQDNLTMDIGESVIPNFSGSLTTFPDNVYMIDITGDGDYEGGEPIFENTNTDDFADPGESSLRSSAYGTTIPMTPFLGIEYFIGGLADYNDGDDIVEILLPSPGPAADGDDIYNFYGPDGIPGVGGDDVLWADNLNGIFEPAYDDAFIDRNNNRRWDPSFEAPGLVLSGDSDDGDPVVPLIPFNFGFNDEDGNNLITLGGDEPCYADVNTNAAVDAGDRRITYHEANFLVGVNDEDVGAPFAQFANSVAPGPAQTIFLDINPNGIWDGTYEPVYYFSGSFTGGPNPGLVSSDAVGADVIRLTGAIFISGSVVYDYEPMSLVHDGDQDLVAPGANFEYFPATGAFGSVTYYDGNSNGVYNAGELVYLDISAGVGIDPGDVRMYTYPDGSTVAAGDADVGVTLNVTLFGADDIAVRDGWGGTPNAYDPGEQVYAGLPSRFAGYTPGGDGYDGFNVNPGFFDLRLTYRPWEWQVVDGTLVSFAGQALAPFTEDIIPNGVLDANLNEGALDETALGVDLNQDGDTADTGVILDINGNNFPDPVVHEDQNYDGILTGPEGNNLFTHTPFNPVVDRFFANGVGGGAYFTPSQNIFRIIRDGAIADVLSDAETDHIKAIGGLIKHCDDGGRGYAPQFPPLYTGALNSRYDDGEVIVFDSDDDLRWDPGEAILTASAMPIDPATGAVMVGAYPAVQPLNAFGPAHTPATAQYIFADVQGGTANGAYDTEEAIIGDLDFDGRWDSGEAVVLNSGAGQLTDWTIERRAPTFPASNDFVLDYDRGGTWSEGPDTPRDLVDAVINTAEGDPLTTFAPDIGYHNVLGVNEYDDFENDEIFRDLDGDGLVTVQQDVAVYPQAGPFASANGDVLNQFVAVPPAPAGANRFAGWVDTGNGVYDGDGGDEEDIYYDTDGDGVVDELDDIMTDFALMNPLSANEPTDIVAVNLWMEDGTTSGFQPGEDTPVGTGTVDPTDDRSWTWTGLSVPVPSEDRNGDGDDDDVLDESVWSMDFNGDGDLLDVVTEAMPDGRGETDSQTRMYATIDISADPQNLLIGNQFDATIPVNGVATMALNNGPTDIAISNSSGLSGGTITIDDYPPTVTRLEQLWLNDFDKDLTTPGMQVPDVIGIYGHGDNIWEVSGNIEMVFRTPSDNDVRMVKVLMATDEAGPWTALDTDPNHGLDIGSDGEPGLAGVDDDGDWNAATDDVGADGIPLTGDVGEGNGVPDAGEPGVDQKDPEVAAAILNPLNDFVDNNDDGYIDDFEFEPPGMDVDRDGKVGEGFPEANQTNGIDDDGDGIIDDDGVDVNGNGIFGEPDPTVGPGGDTDYNLLSYYKYDNDEDGIADSDGTQYMAQLINDNFWGIPDSTQFQPWGSSPTMWSFMLNTKLMQYVLNQSSTLPAYNDIYVKAVAYDLFGNVMPLYAAPTALRLDNLAPAATVAMTDMQGATINDGDQILDSQTYMVGVTSPDDEVMNISLNWAKNGEATFANNLGVIQDVNETLPWSPDPVGNTPPDDTDDYYWEATASDILQWWNETTQQWQPYAFDLDANPATDPGFIGNMEVSALPGCYPAIVTTCLTPSDVAELHVEALNATAPLSAITIIEASPTEIRARGDFADGVRVPAYNAVLLFVDNEDINENGVLDTALNEANLDETADNVDYNKDGDKLDVGVAADLNQDGDMTDIINEDANGNGFLDDGIDDGDGQWWTSDIVGCVFEQRAVNDTNWVPIQTVTGDTVGGVVQDLSYPVAVGWDTRPLAGSEKSYNLRVRSWDVEGDTSSVGVEIVTVTVDAQGLNAYFNQDPSEVSSPTVDGSTVFGAINLYAYSVDPNVTRVQFRYSDDGGATWNVHAVDDNPDAGFGGNPTGYRDWATTFDTSLFPDGDYLFDVVGLDEFGNSDEDPTDMGQQIAVTFMNTAPVVAITSPAAGTIVSALNGNTVLGMQAELQPTAAAMNGLAAGSGEIEAQFQYSIDGGATWQDIDGVNSEGGSSGWQPGDYFADNPRRGLRMGAYNWHPTGAATSPWIQDMIYRKAVGNTDYGAVEVGDYRQTGNPWTDPMYAAGTWVGKDDQDVGTPLTPLVGPIDGGDPVDPAPERFGPFTTTFVTNLVLGNSAMEMAADKVVLLRVFATDVASGLGAAGPTTEITVRENSDPIVDVIEVTDSAGGLVVESDNTDHTSLSPFPDGFTFDDQITVFARAMDNAMTFTDQQGTVTQCQVFYRPRQVDYNYTGVIGWTAGPVDTQYPWIIDVDVSGINGLYEFGLQVTDEAGNTSGIYPQFSCVVDHMASTTTGLPATINEGATFTVGATATAGPIDGTVPYEARFYRSSVVLDEPLTPEFQSSGGYAGYFIATTAHDILNALNFIPGVDVWSGAQAFLSSQGRDVRVDVGGTPGVYHTWTDLQTLASPTPYDFAVSYTGDAIIFAADPTTAGDVTIDYHSSNAIQFGTDQTPPFTADWTPNFGQSGTYDIICVLAGTDGATSPTSGVFSRTVALSGDPGQNTEPSFAEWNLLTVNDVQAPMFTVGGLGRLSTDDNAFASRWSATGNGPLNLGNSVNNADGGPETVLSGDEVDLVVGETGEELDRASVSWAIRDGSGVLVDSGTFTDIGGHDGLPYVHPVTFTLFENDFSQVVQGDDIENVRLWLDLNGDDDWDTDQAETDAEVFPLTDMGDYWQTTVDLDSPTDVEYMFLVDTIGNDLDFNNDGAEDPVDDPRNQLPSSMGGAGYEIDQNNGGTPFDSELKTGSETVCWANVDISALPDGVYFFDFTADDVTGNPTTVSKRVVIDRTPFAAANIAVSTGNEVYTAMPATQVTLFAQVTDPTPADVNVNDAMAVAFQYFDGVDWLWINGGPGNTSANAIDNVSDDGWSRSWTVPDPSQDGKDNDGDGLVDETDEGEFTVQVRAVVRDLGFNLGSSSPGVDFAIDAIAPETSVTLAQTAGDASPVPAEGAVVTLGEWVDLFAPEPANETAEAVVFQYHMSANTGSEPSLPGATTETVGAAADHSAAGSGGPDNFGYVWKDSNEPGGPVFNWVDISAVGTEVPMSGLDDSSGTLNIGFQFPYYGGLYNNFWISENGYISLTDGWSTHNYVVLPSTGAPHAIIAPWWQHLDFRDYTHIYYYSGGDRLIVQFDAIHGHGGPDQGHFTFEVILYRSGVIKFQYASMLGTLDRSMIGMQNDAQNDGLTVAYQSSSYMQTSSFAIQFTAGAGGPGMWTDIDATPLDPDDDYVTGAGTVHETPDYTADDSFAAAPPNGAPAATNYYKVRFDTELIRHWLATSGDLFAEVRAVAIDPVGNEGTAGGTTVLVMNDTEGPLTVIYGFNQPGIGFRYANDPSLALGGPDVTVKTKAVGYNYSDVATTTLQVSQAGDPDWSAWTTVATVVPDAQGMGTFPFDATQYPDGTLYMRAFSTDADGNIGGDANGNGIIDSDEAASVHTIAVMIDNGIPAMALMQAGAYGPGAYFGRSPVDGDIIMPDLLPRETQFQPVLSQNVSFAAWNPNDESPDVFECQLQFLNDVSDPTSPVWVDLADMDYRDDPGDYGPAGAPADGFWRSQFGSIGDLFNAMSAAAGVPLASGRTYRFRALVTSYSGITNHDDPGILLVLDASPPYPWDIAVGNVDMEGGGGGWNMPALHVAGGDVVPIQAYVPDSWADWIPGSGTPPHDPEMAWESAGMFGVQASVSPYPQAPGWRTVGLMTLDPTANLPATYVTTWTAPLNVAATDTMYEVRIAVRDSAGNYGSDTKDQAVVVQDRTPPDGTEITSIYVADGQNGATFPNPVTETTVRAETTQVRGEVTLVAATAAGDASITPDASVYFEVKPDGGDWILINSGDTTSVMPDVATFEEGPPDGVGFAADNAGGVHLGQLWGVPWNTLVTDGDGAQIFPDGHYAARAWCVDIWGNAELLGDVAEVDVWVDNTAPMAQMDADPYTDGVQTTANVERNDVFTAFARTILEGGAEDTSDDATLEFMMKLSTDMNVPGSWTTLAPGYDATDANPDATRPYSFDWWVNHNTPPLAVGAQYNIAASTWDLLGNGESAGDALDDGRDITITIVDTEAPVATITKLVRSIGDPREIEFPDGVCVVGIDSLTATILRGDTDTKFVRFYYRPEGTTDWILADGDVARMGDLTWVLYNWDSSGLAEGTYEFMARAEDDAGNVADGPTITLRINRTGPDFLAVSPQSDVLPTWEPSLSAPTASYTNSGTQTTISPVGPQPLPQGTVMPTGSYTGSESRTYTITIESNGDVGQATFDWSATGSGGSGTGLLTGDLVSLEDGIMVSFCNGTDTPSFEDGDEFTFNTEGKTVDLIVTTDTDEDGVSDFTDVDPNRVFFEYKKSSEPDIDENWSRDAIPACGVLHDDMLNTWSSKWDISGLESCLYDVRLTMWDVCGNWTTKPVAERVVIDNACPDVIISNIANADSNDTTLEPIDFGQITDVTRGVPVEIWATASDDELCLPADHETGVDKLQFQMASGLVAGAGGQADVVFFFDTTGSMSEEQAKAKAAAAAFGTAMQNTGVDFQLGLVDLDGTPGPGMTLLNLTNNVNAFTAAINALNTSGGTIYSYDAMTGALSGTYGLNWRANAKKFFILVTDTSPEGGTASGVNFCSTPNPAEETALISTVGNQATVIAIVETPANDDQGCPEDQSAYDGITAATGGTLFDLDAADYSPLLSQVASLIAAGVGGGWQDLGLYEVPDDAGDQPDVTASQLWDTSGLPEGPYLLRVKAYDDADNGCYSQIVQVNIVDKTPPLARIAGFDPDVLHGDDENTLERVYAMVYSDDEIEDVQFQYLLPGAERWVTFGVGTRIDAGDFDPLEQNNIPEIWASDFNLSDLIALTNVAVGGQFTLRAIAKDSDSNRIDNYRSDRNSPELLVTVVRSPIDGSLALCPASSSGHITDMATSSPRNDNVLVSVSTDAVDQVPRTLVVWEDLTGTDTAAILTMDRTIEVPSTTFQGNVSLSGVMGGGEVAIFATTVEPEFDPVDGPASTPVAIQMVTKDMVVHPVTDALGSNGVASVPRTSSCEAGGSMGATVEVPPGAGLEGGLYIGPADLDVPRTPEAQSYYIQRYGQAYYIELFDGSSDFNPGYEAEVVLTYDDMEGLDETLLAPRYWLTEDDTGMWSSQGISHVKVDTETNEVSFVIDNLAYKNFFSLFTPSGEAPITVTDYIPWSEGYTDHDPEIKAMLYDIFGAGVDVNSVEIYIDGNIVANYGGGWALGNGLLEMSQVNPEGTKYEVVYTHSTVGDPHFQNEKGGDLLDPGQHTLMIKYKNTAGESFELDPAASMATFGVDDTPVRYWWDPGTAENGTPLNFVLGRDPVIRLKVSDLESGIHIEDTWVSDEENVLGNGIKMDVFATDPGGTAGTWSSGNLITTATTNMLVFDPPIDEYDPAEDDTLTVSFPMYDANLDKYNGKELVAVIYTHRDYQDGYYTGYDLAVMDNVGNAGSEFVLQRYRIDVCGPTVEFVTPECGSNVDPQEDVIVTANLTDECELCTGNCGEEAVFEGSGVDSASIRYEVMTPADTATTGRDAKIESGRIVFTLPGPLQLGTHTLTIWVSDVLGNETQAECEFTVNSDDRLLSDAYVYPNPLDPSNGGGTFVVNAGQAGAKVSIDVFDFAGNFVATVTRNEDVNGWGHKIPWDGRAEDGTMLASGPYMARVKVENGDEVMSRTVKVMVWQLDHF